METICDGGHLGAVRCVAFSLDGALAASGGGDNAARIWNAKDGSAVRVCEGHANEIMALAFINGGRGLLTGAAAGDPNPNLVDGPSDGMVRSWVTTPGNGADPKESIRYHGPPEAVTCMAFTANPRRILMYGPLVTLGDVSSPLFIWDSRTGKATRAFASEDLEAIYSICISATSAKAVSTGEDGEIRLWDVNTGKQVRRFPAHAGAVWCAAFSPTGDRLLTGSDDGTVRLWQVGTGKELRSFSGHTGVVRSVAFSADGKQGVSGGDDKTARLWDLAK
jgi:WD40 repeat protein